jgi:hypothetical protein
MWGAGSETWVSGSSFAGVYLDAAAIEGRYSSYIVPAAWATVDIGVAWTNGGAGAGDVAWGVSGLGRIPGEDLAAGLSTSTLVATAGTQGIYMSSTVISGRVVTPGDLEVVEVYRNGSLGSDTLTNDAVLLGVWIERTS